MSNFRRLDRGRSHSYQLDGAHLDGVTDLLSRGLPKPALVNWAARETAEFAADHLGLIVSLERDEIIDLLKGSPWRDRDRAANRGTEVHKLADQLSRGQEVEVPEELVGHVDAYLRWREEWRPVEDLVERPVLNRTWRYAGTIDDLCLLDGRRTLVDLKTNRSGPFAEVALQLAAYGHAEVYLDDQGQEQPMPEVERYRVVWLRADGYEVYPIDVGEREWRTFLWVASVARWLQDRGDMRAPERVIGEALLAASEVRA